MARYISKLKEIRKAADITLEELSDATGISKRTLILIENENGSNPSVDTVMRLMGYFGVQFEDIYP